MCAVHVPENFYRQTITRAVTVTTGVNIYVSAHPTPAEGYIAISPASTNLREIVYYTAKGTDSNGTYLTVTTANRGLGGTTAQTHAIGEPVRMNVSAETIQEISDALDQIVAGGAQDASTSVKGIAKLSVAPVSASNPIAVGDNDPRLSNSPTDVQIFTTTGANTWTKPAGAVAVEVTLIGGGASGGNGVTNQRAGAGGAGGGYIHAIFLASALGATETVTVGAGGTPSYNAGGDTTFGTWLKAQGGQVNNQSNRAGTGGQGIASGSTGHTGDGNPVAGSVAITGGASGGSGSTNAGQSGAVGGNGYITGAAGGGSGGFGTGTSGATGGSQKAKASDIAGGAGGGANTAGSAPSDVGANEILPGAGGGGGGGGASGTTAGAGGAGGKYGGGGGGGGAPVTSGTAGEGGAGGQGIAQVITYF